MFSCRLPRHTDTLSRVYDRVRRRRRRIAAICGRQNEDVKLSWREQTMICVEFMVYLLGSASELFEQFCTIKTILPLHCKLHVGGKSGSICVNTLHHTHTMARPPTTKTKTHSSQVRCRISRRICVRTIARIAARASRPHAHHTHTATIERNGRRSKGM